MKKTYLALLASVLLGFGSVAVADEPAYSPVTMTDAEMDTVVAGNGVDVFNIPGALVVDISAGVPVRGAGASGLGSA